ncbi:MAG: hypothetical protein ABH833_01920 [Parcubacteria group bacterium]
MIEQKTIVTNEDLAKSIDDFAIAVARGFGDVDKRFESIDKRFEGIDKRFEGMVTKQDIANVEGRLQRSIDAVGDRVGRVEEEVTEVQIAVGVRSGRGISRA